MTLKQMVLNGWCRDTDCVTVIKPQGGKACNVQRGSWFQDHVLQYQNEEIETLLWCEGGSYYIKLKETPKVGEPDSLPGSETKTASILQKCRVKVKKKKKKVKKNKRKILQALSHGIAFSIGWEIGRWLFL